MNSLLVFGTINLDFSVGVPRLPRPGETLMGSQMIVSPGGKGANQALAARRFGADVSLVGAVGDDGLADQALTNLVKDGVDLSGLRRLSGIATGAALIYVLASGENLIVVAPGANAALRADWVSEAMIDACDLLLLQMEAPSQESLRLAARVRARGRPVVLNLAPAPDPATIDLHHVDWLIVNQDEAAQLTDASEHDVDSMLSAAQRLRDRGPAHVVVTLGQRGLVYADEDGTLRLPAFPVDAVDTTGAGDTFVGAFAAGLVAGVAPATALGWAQAAAAISVTERAAQPAMPTREQVRARWPDLITTCIP